MEYVCTNCHKPLTPGARICGNCGTSFNTPVPLSPATAVNNPKNKSKPANFPVGFFVLLGIGIFVIAGVFALALQWASSPEGIAQEAAAKKQEATQAKEIALENKQDAQQEAQQKADDAANEKQANQPPSVDQQMTNNATATHDLGDDGILMSRRDSVDVATTEQANSDMNDAAAAKDEIGYDKVLLEDRAFPVKTGTQAKVIGFGSGLAGISTLHVRLESGPHLGDDGWVEKAYFHKQ